MDLSIVVEKIVAIAYLIVGLSMLLQTRPWLSFIDTLQEQGTTAHFIALLTLPMGLIVVLLHPHWSLTTSGIVTLLGWIMTTKCILLLFFPKFILQMIPRKIYLKRIIFFNGLLITVVCLLVLYPLYIK